MQKNDRLSGKDRKEVLCCNMSILRQVKYYMVVFQAESNWELNGGNCLHYSTFFLFKSVIVLSMSTRLFEGKTVQPLFINIELGLNAINVTDETKLRCRGLFRIKLYSEILVWFSQIKETHWEFKIVNLLPCVEVDNMTST